MKPLITALALASLVVSPAVALGPGKYSCMADVQSVLAGGRREVLVYKPGDRVPFERFSIVISTGSGERGPHCMTPGEPGLITAALCSAPYQAQVVNGDRMTRLFGDDPTEFRGHSIYSYLTISEAGYVLSYSSAGIVYTQAGSCERRP